MKTMKAVLISMILASLLSLMGCTDRDKKAIEKIEQYLHEKYGEEFVVHAIGGGYGTLTNNTLKARVYPKSDPDEIFEVEITKDRKTVWDEYMNVIMRDKVEEVAYETIRSVFQEEVYLKSEVVQSGLSYPEINMNDRHISLEEYVKVNPSSVILTDNFINAGAEINIDSREEAIKIDRLADAYMARGVRNLTTSVYFINSTDFAEVMNDYAIGEHPKDYLIRKNMNYKVGHIYVTDSVKEQSIDKITTTLSTLRPGGQKE
ncbi:hypothetical protein [Cohnella mopanensis]|uniref:hypothetical protein n=1 Tax=Cohnella mopanensis TaxID=2911966 RepID=UPI001EF93286|nr:hypothetical protein [Cohnella mopanensis]